MLKTLTAIALASAFAAAPAVAQDVDAPVAPVLASDALPSSGLGAAAVAGGIGIVAIGALAIIASDDDDSAPNSPPNSPPNS